MSILGWWYLDLVYKGEERYGWGWKLRVISIWVLFRVMGSDVIV